MTNYFVFLVSDKAPSNLIVPGITATSLNLSWQFAFEEKLSPFQGFSVFCRRFWPYSLKETFYETTTTRAEIVGLKPFTEYEVRVAPWHLIGLGFISDGITVKTREWGKVLIPMYFALSNPCMPRLLTLINPDSTRAFSWQNPKNVAREMNYRLRSKDTLGFARKKCALLVSRIQFYSRRKRIK